MTKSTHLIGGLALGLALPSGDLRLALGLAVVAGFGALVPDFDLRVGLPHRGVTHSLLALGLVALLAFHGLPLLVALALVGGYGSHLVLDSLTVSGVPLLWPLRFRFKLARFVTGHLGDRLLGACLSLCAVWLVVRGLV